MNDKTIETKQFEIVSSGFDEYPDDGLRFAERDRLGFNILYEKNFCDLELQEGDTVEVTVKIISRWTSSRKEMI